MSKIKISSVLMIIAFIAVLAIIVFMTYNNVSIIMNAQSYLKIDNETISQIKNINEMSYVSIESAHGYWCKEMECIDFCQIDEKWNVKVCTEWCGNNTEDCNKFKNYAAKRNITLNFDSD